MSDLRVHVKQKSVSRASDDTWAALRATRDGSPIVLPWQQALVMEGVVFAINAGSVTTPIAGHAAIDADQPEAAAYFATGVAVIPLSVRMAMETGATTLAQGGMMCAFSNINVGVGTSTAATPMNCNLLISNASSGSGAVAYTGNGTDPLTAGNFIELARVSGNFDADAAAQGTVYPVLKWTAMDDIFPVLGDACSLLAYGEAAANTLFATLMWAELDHSDFS